MASVDVIREAALYLEYFLKGMSECSVIGSYTVQFLEMRSFSMRLQTSLVSHLVQLVLNMKGLLMKLDGSLLPICNAEVQTEEKSFNFLCRCQESTSEPLKSIPLEDAKDRLNTTHEKAFESPDLVQLLASTPLIQLKQEITCVPEAVASNSSQCHEVGMAVNDVVDFKEIKSVETLKIRDNNLNTDSQIEKCALTPALHTTLDDNMDLDYGASSHLEEDTQGQILLDDLEGSDGAHSDGLMYSVYTMNPCGSLQLVSRVLSKSTSSRDSVEEPVERATIKINNMKQDDRRSQTQLQSLTLHEDIKSSQCEFNQEEMVVAPDISDFQERPLFKSTNRRAKSRKIFASQGSPTGTILTDVVKLGPEDLCSATWCGVCEKEFPSAGSLKVHLSRMHSQVKWCHTCNKTIDSEEEMCDHVRECHGDLPFICLICGQSLRTNAAFQRHKDIHKGLRGSACEICGQTFSRTEYYREHKRIHTGEKPYECEICKKTFSRSSNLYTHMRIHNDEEQRHICNVCMKSFARADKLKDHMIRHLQIKRYGCRLCPKAYNEKRDLTKHLEKVHSGHNSLDT